MKNYKSFLLLVVVLSTTILSCKKDHVCTCEFDGTTDTFVIESSTRSDAEEECAEQDEILSEFGGFCNLD